MRVATVVGVVAPTRPGVARAPTATMAAATLSRAPDTITVVDDRRLLHKLRAILVDTLIHLLAVELLPYVGLEVVGSKVKLSLTVVIFVLDVMRQEPRVVVGES